MGDGTAVVSTVTDDLVGVVSSDKDSRSGVVTVSIMRGTMAEVGKKFAGTGGGEISSRIGDWKVRWDAAWGDEGSSSFMVGNGRWTSVGGGTAVSITTVFGARMVSWGMGGGSEFNEADDGFAVSVFRWSLTGGSGLAGS